jgi:hypothetical protein
MNKGSVLFISPAFFGYEESICNAIVKAGYTVDFFDERTSNKSVLKAIFRVWKNLLSYSINKYYKGILKNINQKKYTHFLLIKGEVVPVWFIKAFKKLNPTAKLIYYTYDSFNNNNQNALFILEHFDGCYSFDFEDVKRYPIFKLKHLFFTEEFLVQSKSPDKKYLISFVGTLHSTRYKIVKDLFNGIDNVFVFFYSPAKWFFNIEKILKKDHKKIDLSEVSFSKISKEGVANIFKSSKVVLDIQRTGQTGLTMRTFEVLASGAILATTNTFIKQTEFYNPSFIVVCENLNGEGLVELREKIRQIPQLSMPLFNRNDQYYIDNWIREFFA